MNINTGKWLALSLVLLASIITVGFFYKNQSVHAQTAEAQSAPTPVDVETVESEPVRIWHEFSARLEPVDVADIRPQVSGQITEVRFEDGSPVEKDQILFVIDPRPYEAALQQAKADLQAAKDNVTFTKKEFERAAELIEEDNISERLYDERLNAANRAKAALEAAKAELQLAEIDMDHAYVKAPIAGQISRAELTVGNLVQAGPNAPVLASIVANDPIYASFEVDEATYLRYVRNAGTEEKQTLPVRLVVGGDNVLYEGEIHSFDNRIQTASGTIRARALLDNADGALLPGMFASVELGSASEENLILVSERAIGTNQDRKFVYVIGDDQTAQYREIKIGESVSGQRIILSGLEAGEKIIADGIIRIRPGMPVSAKPEE